MKRILAFSPGYAAQMHVGLTLWQFYPGFMGCDSAHQWWKPELDLASAGQFVGHPDAFRDLRWCPSGR